MGRICSVGHPTVPDPPSHPLVRLPCGCALATASSDAIVREFKRPIRSDEREHRIRIAVAMGQPITRIPRSS
jgi:DNA-binding transcriptional LysR family regulator